MAYITETRRPSLGDWLRTQLARHRAQRARYALYRRTVSELSALSDRDLEDLGISRLSIEDIAYEHAYAG